MSGTADREPFCDSLYNPKENDLDLGKIAGVVDGKGHHRRHHAPAGAGGPRIIHAQQTGAQINDDDLQHQRRTADDPDKGLYRTGQQPAPAHGAKGIKGYSASRWN